MVNHRIATKSALFILVSLIGTTATLNSAMAQAEIFSNKENLSFGVTSLMAAVVDNDVDGVRFFLKSSDSVNQRNMGGATALHIACRTQNTEIARILLENGADVNLVDAEGWTPLMRASLSKSAEIVSLLLSKGAKIETLNNFKDSAIVHAAMSDCNECLDYVIAKSDFVKTADIKTLKSQISRSFVIARNHDNRVGQEILTSGLDTAIRFAANSSEDTVAIKSHDEKVTHGLKEPAEIVDLSYGNNKDLDLKPNAEESSHLVALESKELLVPEQNQPVEAEQKQIVTSGQKLDDESDATTLTEKDMPPIVIAKIESKEAVAPVKIQGSKKFKLTQGPSVVKPEIALQEPPISVAEESDQPLATIIEEPKENMFSAFLNIFRKKEKVVAQEIASQEPPVSIAEDSQKAEIQPLATVIEEPKESRFSAFLNIFRKKEKVVADVKSEPSNVVEKEQQETESKKDVYPLTVSEKAENVKEEPKDAIIKKAADDKSAKKFKFVSGPKVEVQEDKLSSDVSASDVAVENSEEKPEILVNPKKEEEIKFFKFLNFFSKKDVAKEVSKEKEVEVKSEVKDASKEISEKQIQPEINDIQATSEESKKSGFFSFLNFFSKKNVVNEISEEMEEEFQPEYEDTSEEISEKQIQPEINDIQVASKESEKSGFFSFLNFFSKKKESPIQEIQYSEPKSPKKFKLSVGKM